MTVKVNCIIPTHGRGHELTRAINSILAQTYLNFDLTVVDDLGTGIDLIHRSELQPRVRLVDITGDEFRTAGHSRNVGAMQGTAEYIAFLDDDDEWAPGMLTDAIRILEASAVDFVVSWGDLKVSDRVRGAGWRMPAENRELSFASNPGFTGSNVVIRREVFNAVGGFDATLPVLNDLDLYVRLRAAGYRYSVTTSINVFQHADGDTHLSSRGERRAAGIRLYAAKHRARLSRRDSRELRREYYVAKRHANIGTVDRIRYILLTQLNSTPRQILNGFVRLFRPHARAYED